jgi:elongation factor G
MRIHITVPDEHVGKVIGDLNSRRAQINESTTQDTSDTGRTAQLTQSVVDAFVPLSETFQYTTRLRSMTQGRGAFTLEFSHYEVVPESLAPGATPIRSV